MTERLIVIDDADPQLKWNFGDVYTSTRVKVLYELNTDTNAFTDAEKSKLSNAPDTGSAIKILYEGEADTNAYTDAEKSKLAGLESSHFKGEFVNLAALEVAHPTAAVGDYANVDAGLGSDVTRYVWDDSDTAWVAQLGESTSLTAVQVKTLYESNADTNALTDAGLALVNGSLQRSGGTLTGAIDWGDTFGQHINFFSTTYGFGLQAARMYQRAGEGFSWFVGGVHSDDKKNPGGGGLLAADLDEQGNLRLAGGLSLAGGALVTTLGGSGGVGSGTERTLGVLNKSFAIAEEYALSLLDSTVTPVVTVTKETPLLNQSDPTWGVTADDPGYVIEDTAKDIAVTISADTGEITLTLASGTWDTADERKTFVGKDGKAVIIGTGGSAAIDAYVTEDFDLSGGSVVLAGGWELYSIITRNGVMELSGQAGSGLTHVLPYSWSLTTADQSVNLSNSKQVSIRLPATTEYPSAYWCWCSDGTHFYTSNGSFLKKYKVAVPYLLDDVDGFGPVQTGGDNYNPIGVRSDGLKLIVNGPSGITELNMTVRDDLSTAVEGNSKSLGVNVLGARVSDDGTVLYTKDSSNYDLIKTYTMNPAWDVTTLTATGHSLDHSTEDINMIPFDVSEDGLMIVVCKGSYLSSKIYRYNMSVAHDISTASYSFQSISFGVDPPNISAVILGKNGLKTFTMFDSTNDQEFHLWAFYTWGVLGSGNHNSQVARGMTYSGGGGNYHYINQSTGIIYSYTVTTPGYEYYLDQLSTANGSLNISAKEAQARGLFMNDEGTVMLVLGNVNGIHEYNVVTPHTPSTATFVDTTTLRVGLNGGFVTPDGSKLLIFTSWDMYQYSFGTPWDASTLTDDLVTISLATLGLRGYFQSAVLGKDGDVLYVVDDYRLLYEFALNTAFDISSAVTTPVQIKTLMGRITQPGAMNLAPIGDNVLISDIGTNDEVYQIDLQCDQYEQKVQLPGTPNMLGANFDPTGTKIHVANSTTDSFQQFTCSTPWDPSTATDDLVPFDYSVQVGNVYAFVMSPDGTRIIIWGHDGVSYKLFQYNLSVAWDLSSCSYSTNFDLTASGVTYGYCMQFNGDGSKLFLLDHTTKYIERFSLPTPYNLASMSYDSVNYDCTTLAPNIVSFVFSDDGLFIYLVSGSYFMDKWSLTIAFDITSTIAREERSRSLYINSSARDIMFLEGGVKFAMAVSTNFVVFDSSLAGGPEPFPTYVDNSYELATTVAPRQILSGFWSDINDVAIADAPGTGAAYYAFSLDQGVTWFVCKDLNSPRNIVRDNAGIWEYNAALTYDGAELWVDTTENTIYSVFRAAMTVADNVMDSTQAAAVTDPYWPDPGLYMDLARILYTSDNTVTPTTGQVTIDYDTSGVQDGAVHGTDYDYSLTAPNEVTITSNIAATLRVRVTGE